MLVFKNLQYTFCYFFESLKLTGHVFPILLQVKYSLTLQAYRRHVSVLKIFISFLVDYSYQFLFIFH